MAQHSVTQSIDASASEVWALLADFGDIRWIPVAGDVVVEGHGVGMRRLIGGSGGSPVVERLIAIDPDERSVTYSIDENNPFPVTTYQAVTTVGEDGDGCAVTWVVDFEAAGETTDAEVAGAVEAMYGVMATWLGDAARPTAAG